MDSHQGRRPMTEPTGLRPRWDIEPSKRPPGRIWTGPARGHEAAHLHEGGRNRPARPTRTLQNPHSGKSDRNRVMIRRTVIPFTAMSDPQPSARAAANPGTVRLAMEVLERTAGRRRRCRRCRSVIAENARKRGQAWSVCTPCVQAIEDDARQVEIEPALLRRCLVCRTDIAQLRAGARTCGDACRNVLSRLLRGRRCSVP